MNNTCALASGALVVVRARNKCNENGIAGAFKLEERSQTVIACSRHSTTIVKVRKISSLQPRAGHSRRRVDVMPEQARDGDGLKLPGRLPRPEQCRFASSHGLHVKCRLSPKYRQSGAKIRLEPAETASSERGKFDGRNLANESLPPFRSKGDRWLSQNHHAQSSPRAMDQRDIFGVCIPEHRSCCSTKRPQDQPRRLVLVYCPYAEWSTLASRYLF